MNTATKIIECVPNISEGRDKEKINAIANAIKKAKDVRLLHVDSSPAANRTVFTFAGSPEAVSEAAFRMMQKTTELIDMRSQEGVHPRIGAVDVCPLVPLYNVSMQEVVTLSQQLGARVGNELNIPIYLYEHAAQADYRRALPAIRKGQYEGFEEKMKNEKWQPDYGPQNFNAATGATVMGARAILVAFNIALNTKDVNVATKIANQMRESGYTEKTPNGVLKHNGLLPQLRAIGWYMKDYEMAQVSFNLLNYQTTSPLKVWQTCKLLADEMGVKITGCEVIGLLPEACLLEAGRFALAQENLTKNETEKVLLIQKGIELMGLQQLKPFDPQEKILEYALKNAGLLQ
jgi:glutamate formiminotransferase/formiminotetrahydrofolate cyclodeaminase